MRYFRKLSCKLTTAFNAIIRLLKKIVKALLYELTAEIILAIGSFGFALLFAKLGIPDLVAIAVGFVITVILGITVYILFERPKLKTTRRSNEVKFAYCIAKYLSNQASDEWSEYQDWVHDILLARYQLLEQGCPSWKAAWITFWRLGGLCIVVGLIRLRKIATTVMKWR